MQEPYLKWMIVIFTALLFILVSKPARCQHGWPLGPTNVGHPIGNSFGEFQDYGGCINTRHCIYQHSGIDILGTPKYDSNNSVDPTAPWVFATVRGTVEEIQGACNQTEDSTSYYTSIKGADGLTYRYGHLQRCSYDPDLVFKANNGQEVEAGSPIAQLVRWYVCDYHHLHYDILKNDRFVNPLAGITPHDDGEPAEIAGIFFARSGSDPWEEIRDRNLEGCLAVSGEVEIIAQVRDRDSAGSNQTLWVRNILWRACPESDPDCAWTNTYSFDEIPIEWNTTGNNRYTSAYFSVRDPWVSIDDYCQQAWFYAVVTNFVGGRPDGDGSWNTRTIFDGGYLLSLKAIDFGGNETTYTTKVCVNNGRRGDDVPPGAPNGFRISPD